MCLCFCNSHRDTVFLIKKPKFPQNSYYIRRPNPLFTLLPHRRGIFYISQQFTASSRHRRKQLVLIFFVTARKRSLGKYLKKEKSGRWRVKNKTAFLSEHTCANRSHAQHEQIFTGGGALGLNMSCDALIYREGGGVQTIPTCKTKFTKCLEFWSVSRLSLAQTNQKKAACARMCGRQEKGLSYLSFYSPNFLTVFHTSRWSSRRRVTAMHIRDMRITPPENKSFTQCYTHFS